MKTTPAPEDFLFSSLISVTFYTKNIEVPVVFFFVTSETQKHKKSCRAPRNWHQVLNYHLALSRATQWRVLSVGFSPRRQTDPQEPKLRLVVRLIMKNTTLLSGYHSTHPSQLQPQIFGEFSVGLGANLKASFSFSSENSKLPWKGRTHSLYGSGPFSSSQLRTGTGEMLWATLASGLFSNSN